jgi:hypothetical protein
VIPNAQHAIQSNALLNDGVNVLVPIQSRSNPYPIMKGDENDRATLGSER